MKALAFETSYGVMQDNTNGKASLSSTPMPIELTQTDDGTGRYDDSENPFTWIIKKVNTKDYTTDTSELEKRHIRSRIFLPGNLHFFQEEIKEDIEFQS